MMLRITDTLAGDTIKFNCVESRRDLREVVEFVKERSALGIDTESTGINCYRTGWQLRTVQIGDSNTSYVIPARWVGFIKWLMISDTVQHVRWIGHNGPHDIRCIDRYLGFETGVACAGETYIPAHHADSRKRDEGGVGHELKELAIKHIDPDAGKWERELKRVFKTLEVPIPGAVYKSGKRKGQPKVRKARLSEGWALIDPMHPAYIAYAAADPILTYRVWRQYQPTLRQFYDLYHFDKRIQMACDRLQRRAIRLDIPYTRRLSNAFSKKADEMITKARELGCDNIHSGKQLADTLLRLGVPLRVRTPTGQYKTDDHILRAIAHDTQNPQVRHFITSVLVAKQLLKRRENYTEAMLREVSDEGRIHPSIKSLGARTARMSVSNPPLQQLPTKDRESEIQ